MPTKSTKYGKTQEKSKPSIFDWRTMFLKNSGGLSSKRVLGVLGIITCIIVFIAAFIFEKEVPEFGEFLLICCVSLYGVELIPNIWNKTINKS